MQKVVLINMCSHYLYVFVRWLCFLSFLVANFILICILFFTCHTVYGCVCELEFDSYLNLTLSWQQRYKFQLCLLALRTDEWLVHHSYWYKRCKQETGGVNFWPGWSLSFRKHACSLLLLLKGCKENLNTWHLKDVLNQSDLHFFTHLQVKGLSQGPSLVDLWFKPATFRLVVQRPNH